MLLTNNSEINSVVKFINMIIKKEKRAADEKAYRTMWKAKEFISTNINIHSSTSTNFLARLFRKIKEVVV